MNQAKRHTKPSVWVIVGIFASLGITLGSAGPWGSFEISTWDNYHRIATMSAGAVAAVVLMSLVAKPRFGQPWIAVGMGAVAWAVAIVTVVYVEATWEPRDEPRDPTWCEPPRFGWGLSLTTISSIVLIMTSTIVLVRSRRLRWLVAICGPVAVSIHIAGFILLSASAECGIQ